MAEAKADHRCSQTFSFLHGENRSTPKRETLRQVRVAHIQRMVSQLEPFRLELPSSLWEHSGRANFRFPTPSARQAFRISAWHLIEGIAI